MNKSEERDLIADFGKYCTLSGTSDYFLGESKDMLPMILWSVVSDVHPHLGPLMAKLHKCPASAAGGERNHKTAKAISMSLRSRLNSEKIETQTSIAFKFARLCRTYENYRSDKVIFLLKSMTNSCRRKRFLLHGMKNSLQI